MFMWTLLWNLPQTCWIHTIRVDKKVSVKNNKKKTQTNHKCSWFTYTQESFCESFPVEPCADWFPSELAPPSSGTVVSLEVQQQAETSVWCPCSLAWVIPTPLWYSPLPHSLSCICPKWKPLWDCPESGTPHFLKRLPAMVENSNHSNTAWI